MPRRHALHAILALSLVAATPPVTALAGPVRDAAMAGDAAEFARLLTEHGAGPSAIAPVGDALASADGEKGRQRAFACNECHAFEPGKASEGPSLWEVVGRPKATLPDYPYSDALRAQPGAWEFEELNRFLAQTTRVMPGTAMDHGFEPDRATRIDLIAYLRTLSDSPVPLP